MDYRYIRITDINEDGTLNDDWKTVAEVEKQYILKEGDVLLQDLVRLPVSFLL